jgi:hypothetical protein
MFAAARFGFVCVMTLVALAVGACSHDSKTTTEPGGGDGGTGTILYNVSFDSGLVDSASMPVGSAVALHVHVTRSGAAAASTPVIWSITSGGGHVSADTTITDALGAASVTWTLSDTAGLNAITVKAGDNSASTRMVGIAGAAGTLSKRSIDSVTVAAGASLPLTVKVGDDFGNGVAGATVTWAASGGPLSATSSTSGTSGNADVVFTTSASDAQPATYQVTATLPGKASVTFTIKSR